MRCVYFAGTLFGDKPIFPFDEVMCVEHDLEPASNGSNAWLVPNQETKRGHRVPRKLTALPPARVLMSFVEFSSHQLWHLSAFASSEQGPKWLSKLWIPQMQKPDIGATAGLFVNLTQTNSPRGTMIRTSTQIERFSRRLKFRRCRRERRP